jgi:hypothetical protein
MSTGGTAKSQNQVGNLKAHGPERIDAEFVGVVARRLADLIGQAALPMKDLEVRSSDRPDGLPNPVQILARSPMILATRRCRDLSG